MTSFLPGRLFGRGEVSGWDLEAKACIILWCWVAGGWAAADRSIIVIETSSRAAMSRECVIAGGESLIVE